MAMTLRKEWRQLTLAEDAPCQAGECPNGAAYVLMIWLPYGGIGFHYYCDAHVNGALSPRREELQLPDPLRPPRSRPAA
jgi:hypothetical protein